MGLRRAETLDRPLIQPGPGRFHFRDERSGSLGPLTVRYYLPSCISADSAPVVFVMHGVKRDADTYRDNWAEIAEEFEFLLICPEFGRAEYPRRTSYQLGNLAGRGGELLPKHRWTFDVIERLFDHIKKATGNTNERYHIYGHSAGAQFVHRLALFLPEARFATAIAANTGWYTMPTFDGAKFPYGLRGSACTPEGLKAALGNRLVVMLGERDDDSDAPYLRRSKGAKKQGETRLERGQNFYATALREAEKLEARPGWKLIIVPEAPHLDRQMMPVAARELFGRPSAKARGKKAS